MVTCELVDIRQYHARSVHHSGRLARLAGFLDWATMPSPFLAYRGAPLIDLPHERANEWPACPWDTVYHPGQRVPQPVTLRTVATFLRHALGLSAWKEVAGERWSLRVNPSSGNLHPTEAYVVTPQGSAVQPASAVCHYRADLHALELRGHLADAAWADAMSDTPDGSFLVGLTTIAWREAWKYGERAYRYCQHDAGHALAALSFSAALLGWDLALLPAWSDEAVSTLLGLAGRRQGPERETPTCLAIVAPGMLDRTRLPTEADGLLAAARMARWLGTAEPLSRGHQEWSVLEAAESAAAKPRGTTWIENLGALPPPRAPVPSCRQDARALVRGRRSAVDFDPGFTLSRESFLRMLERTLPQETPPWTVLSTPAQVHLFLFVHRVEGVTEGLYALPRSADALAPLRAATRGEFPWAPAYEVAPGLSLFQLVEGDVRLLAERVSCGQAIAGEGAFSLGMVTRFDDALTRDGPWSYRRLFWEAGMVGQVLYLEAEAARVRGTGIGCFFDSAMHDLLGLRGTTFQSLYHFTAGRPVEDPRLQLSPGYPWE